MNWETKGVARFSFSSALHGCIVGQAKCLLCVWRRYVTGGENFADVVEDHMGVTHLEIVSGFGVLSAPEGNDAVDYFVVTHRSSAGSSA